MKIVVTSSQAKSKTSDLLEAFLKESGFPYIARQKKSIRNLLAANQADYLIVWDEGTPVAYNLNLDKFFFHPSMAKTRISLYRKEQEIDNLIKASALKKGDVFLDCTLGLGADAIVAAYFVENTKVIALEKSPLIAMLIKWGMKNYKSSSLYLIEAISRIEVINVEHYNFLNNALDNSFDIVYFDPMFRQAQLKSQALNKLRSLACSDKLESDSIKEAIRVARKKVLVKEKINSGEFERLGIKKIIHSVNNPIAYGVIDV